MQKRNSDKKLIVEQKNSPVQTSTITVKPINNKNEINVTVTKKDNTASIQSPAKPAAEILLTETRSQLQPWGKQLPGIKRNKNSNRQKYEQAPHSLEKIPAKKTDEVKSDFDRNNPVSTAGLSIAGN
ncbi:MAG: hypothetical protein ACXWWC_15815, partial [Chitinophagaceae bacterium]